jgi:lysophospholipase L1-like esterase
LRESSLAGHFAVNCVGAAASGVMEILPTILLFAMFGFGIVVLQCDPLSLSHGDLNQLVKSSLVSFSNMKPQVRVINEGFPGENTAELDARLDGVLDQSKPDYVVLFVGTNDALNENKFLTLGETERHLEAMVRRAKRRGAGVIMVTVHDPDLSRLMARHKPEAYGDTPPLQRLAMVNDRIRTTAQIEHAQLVPFDVVLRKAGGANAELSTDGVHLTAKGYGILASAVREQLPKHLPEKATILCFGDSLTYGIGVRPANSLLETGSTYPAQLRDLLSR